MSASNLPSCLSGRSVAIEVFTLSYAEFLEFCHLEDSDEALGEYMTYGGFPLALMVRGCRVAEMQAIEGIQSTVILRDVVMRGRLRNLGILGRIYECLMMGIGVPVSANSIRNSMGVKGQRVNHGTVDAYLGYLEESRAFYRAKRFDVKAKEDLSLNDKFYPADPGLRTASLGRRDADIGHVMESIVFLELRRRGYTVRVGKMGDREIDFVATRGSEFVYLQVCNSMNDPDVEAREIGPLMDVRDNYRKVVVVMVPSLNIDRSGIEEMTLREFLLGEL